MSLTDATSRIPIGSIQGSDPLVNGYRVTLDFLSTGELRTLLGQDLRTRAFHLELEDGTRFEECHVVEAGPPAVLLYKKSARW